MRTLWLKVFTLVLLATSTFSAVSGSGVAQKTKAKTAQEKTVVGYISDSSCGLQHMPGMDEKECTLMCAKNGKFVLADRDHELVYRLIRPDKKRPENLPARRSR